MAFDNTLYSSPDGVAAFANLNEPRQYKGKGAFAFDVTLVLEGEAAADFAQEIDAAMEDAGKQFPNSDLRRAPYAQHRAKNGVDAAGKPVYEDVPGALAFKFRVPAEWPNGQSRQPTFFNAEGEIIAPDEEGTLPLIRSGSRIALNFLKYTNNVDGKCGVTLQPVEVQIIELQATRKGFANRTAQPETVATDEGSTAPPPATDDDIPF